MADVNGKALSLDERQAEAVALERNAVVCAGAGSGKTTVLAERYVRLIREGRAGVDQILTLTFTRKAAAEMYERIYRRLSEEQAETRVREALGQFDQAHISTLDSFCAQVVRNWPQRFGVPPTFKTDDEEAGRLAEETALAFVLEHQDDPALVRFIADNSFQAVWQDFFARLGSAELSVASPIDFELDFQRQMAALSRELSARTGTIVSMADAILELEAPTDTAKATQAVVSAAGVLPELLEAEDYRGMLNALDALRPKKPSGKHADVKRMKDLVGELRPVVEETGEIIEAFAARDTIHGVMSLCGEYQTQLLARRRAAGILTFQDVVDMAIAILRENRELRGYYGRKFRYIMIDEFQDNNQLQRDLLFLLSEEPENPGDGIPTADRIVANKLFFVGDEKQSIYRFRGADVSVFKRLRDDLESFGGFCVELRKNYRSDPGLIRFYNDLFRRVMGDAEEDFEARFEPLEARSEQSDLAPRISIFYKPYNAEAPEGILSQDDAEAYHIARYVRNVVEEQLLQVPSGDATRPVTYGDIALLMRSTSNQIRYERMLRLFGVPYTTQSVRSLFLEAPLNDMYSLLQLVVYPTDRVAYAALLRSPFVQLSDDSLLSVLLREQEPFAACELPDEDAGKYAQGAELYRWCRERADRWSNAELISGLWFEWGYRFVLLRDPAYHGYLEYYDYFKRLAERADARGRALAAFLDELRPNLGRYERLPDLEVVQDRSEGVQLLTIHKSKGLEFPVVILANTGNVGARDNQGSAPYYRSSEYGVTLNVSSTHATKRRRQNYFYRVGKSEAERREHAELKRLLYVALTRAESHLVISGCHHRTNQRAEGALLNMVRDALGEDFGVQRAETPVVVKEIPDVPEDAQYKSPVRRLRVSSAAASAAYHEAPVKRREARSVEISPTELNERHLMQVELGAGELLPALAADAAIEGDDLEAAFGTLCHLVIQQELGGGFLEGLMPPGLERRIPERVRGRLVADAVGLARAFLDSPFFASLESGERAGELPFVFRLSTPEASTVRYFVNGTIDLLIEFATSVHVVDFKTDRFLRIGEYDAQLEVYRRAAEALTGKPARATLYYLRAGRPVDVEGGYPLERLVDPP